MKFVNGKPVSESAADIVQQSIDETASVDTFREGRRYEFRNGANVKIAAFYGKLPGSMDLVYAQMNALSRAAELLDKKISATITASEQVELDQLQTVKNQITAIRNAENVASSNLDTAGADTLMTADARKSEISAVTAAWP